MTGDPGSVAQQFMLWPGGPRGTHRAAPMPRRPSDPRLRAAFGATLRARRIKAGLTQEALAEAVGLHPVHLGRLERGTSGPSLEAVWALAEALGCRPRDLVADTEKAAAR